MTTVSEQTAIELAQLVASMVCPLVEYKERVSVSVDRTSHRVMLQLETDPSDSGRIIGSKGRTIRAIREILFSASRASGVFVELDYVNDRRSRM